MYYEDSTMELLAGYPDETRMDALPDDLSYDLFNRTMGEALQRVRIIDSDKYDMLELALYKSVADPYLKQLRADFEAAVKG